MTSQYRVICHVPCCGTLLCMFTWIVDRMWNVEPCCWMQEVVNFCRKYLTVNAEAFRSNRLDLVINCARSVHAVLISIATSCINILNVFLYLFPLLFTFLTILLYFFEILAVLNNKSTLFLFLNFGGHLLGSVHYMIFDSRIFGFYSSLCGMSYTMHQN